MGKKTTLLVFVILLQIPGSLLLAQNKSIEELMNEESAQDSAQRTELTSATFESSRLIEGHSVETTAKQSLDLRISHRFGRLEEGIYDFFGMDNASIRVGCDYGITDRLTVGAGRSSWSKEYDVSGKYKILQQSSGKQSMPVSMTVLGELMINTLKYPDEKISVSERLSTATEVLIARKFNSILSAQIMPIWIHYERTPIPGDPKDIFSVGIGGSIKFSKRMRLNIEYYPLFANNRLSFTTAPLSIGLDIQTGGHVFQIFISNSIGTNERILVTQTFDRWDKGQLHLGFNILRVFSF